LTNLDVLVDTLSSSVLVGTSELALLRVLKAEQEEMEEE
jgi:hypothetical protein